jgi:uncharacterized membrane protein
MRRFRDSWPIRTGVGIIAFWFLVFITLWIAYRLFGYNPAVGPTGLWAVIWIIVSLLLIAVGIGQTIVRRR